jgi:hypothetical protein
MAGKGAEMIGSKLHDFIERSIDAKYISEQDVEELLNRVLPFGIESAREAEALLALDRSVVACKGWCNALVSLVSSFVVRGLGSEGRIGYDHSLWLSTTLDVGGPTETTMAIAYAVLDRAAHVDAVFLEFIMRGRQHARLQPIAA